MTQAATELGTKLLILDDSPLALHIEKKILSDAGYEVRTASTLAEFNELTVDWAPHLILTDVEMPEMAGSELCRRLKARGSTRRIPVVLLSNLPEWELARIAREAGADGYISKKHGAFALAAEVERHLALGSGEDAR